MAESHEDADSGDGESTASKNFEDSYVYCVIDPKDYFDIMVIGKTGQGKSTTANKLLGLDVDARSGTVTVSAAVTVQLCFGAPDSDSKEAFFAVAEPSDCSSKTQCCKILSHDVAKLRVLDVPGFADSRKRTLTRAATDRTGTPPTVYEANLAIVRGILNYQTKIGLAFDRVLYFLPIHGPLCKADGCVQEEIKVMHHFFGVSIFDRMIIVTTWPPRQSMADYSFTEEDISDTKRSFELALKEALGEHAPKCPEIRYISLKMTPQEVLEVVKATPVAGGRLTFREDVCVRCTGKIKKFGDQKHQWQVVYDEETTPYYYTSKCHPRFYPRYSTVAKVFGGLAHVATLGTSLLIGDVLLKSGSWPGFTNSEEVCPHCSNPPGSRGCCKVGEDVTVQFRKIPSETIAVDHTNKLDY